MTTEPDAPADAAFADGWLLAGDCLERLADARAHGPFDVAYVDPPFNAGGARGARLEGGARVRGEVAYADRWGGTDGFLSMLRPRLAAVAATLTDDGVLWLHLDHRAVHEAKVLLDELLGRGAFRGEIIWLPGNGGRGRGGPRVTHQTLLVYCRGALRWQTDHPSLREPYAETSLSMHFRARDQDGRAYRERVLGGRAYRYYADEGRPLGSVWTDLPAMRANTPLRREATGYPTQKPLALLERILRLTAPPGGRVLDPMCGSGTTAMAARSLGHRWVAIDRSPVALAVAAARLGAEGAGPG